MRSLSSRRRDKAHVRKRKCHVHLISSNKCTLLRLLCILTGRYFSPLAMATAASQISKRKWSLPYTRWKSMFVHLTLDNKLSAKPLWLSWIRNSLPNHSFDLPTYLCIRGGSDEVDFSDIDDDIPAEDLLDAIFENPKDLPMKLSWSKQEEKLQASIEQKSGVSSYSLSKTPILNSKPMLHPSKVRSLSQQKRLTMPARTSSPKQKKGNKFHDAGSASNSKTSSGTSNSFYDEPNGHNKKSLLMSQDKAVSGASTEGIRQKRDGKHHVRQRNLIRGLEDDVLTKHFVDNERKVGYEKSNYHVSRNQRSTKQDDYQRRDASLETSTSPRMRTKNAVSTSGTPKTSSSVFVRRKSPTMNTETNLPTSSKQHGVWGWHVQHSPTKSDPPPTKATEEEQRAHEAQSRLRRERKKLLSNLAIRMNDSHLSAIRSLIRGNAAHIPPELFGQTIMQEKSACNEKFYESMEGVQSSLGSSNNLGSSSWGEEVDTAPSFRHIEDSTLLSYWGLTPYAKLYGGAQYHRVLRYYHHMFLTVPLPRITDDEIALLTNGVTEVHDASDLMRAVALLVRQKMEIVMEDVLADMTRRLLYVLDRLWEMVEYSMALHRPMGGANGLGKSGDKVFGEAELLNRHGLEYHTAESGLKNVLSASFHNFARERAALAHRQSLEDIRSLLRYVTWDMGRARKRMPNQNTSNGFVTQIEIVGSESPASVESEKEQSKSEKEQSKKKVKRRTKEITESSPSISGSSERIMARGGGAVGSGRKRSRRWKEKEKIRNQGLSRDGDDTSQNDEENDMGDLVGGVLDRGKLDDSIDENNANKIPSMVITSESSPLFSGDDEVLAVLLATVSSTLTPISDIQASHTQVAIENLVSYVADRMRIDISRMIRSKFNTFFLLAFYEDLGPYMSRQLDAYLSNFE